MCIISAFPSGTEKNNEKTRKFIENGFNCNGDGSGFMFKRHNEGTITINKGFFNLGELLQAIENANLTVDDELVVHHRISTAGKVSKENCHPFVLSKSHSETAAVTITTNKLCLAHNGHFSHLSFYQDLDRDFSDTYAFSRYILSSPHLQKIMRHDEDLFDTLTENIIGHSKICILDPNNPMFLYGDFVEDDGYYHSNKGYCRYEYNYGGRSSSKTYGFPKDWSEGHSTNSDTAAEAYWKGIQDDRERRTQEFLAGSAGKTPLALKLDSNTINITNKNCTHFNFINKKKYENFQATKTGKLELATMENFDPKAEMQTLMYKEEGKEGVAAEAILTSLILTNYWFLPKMNYIVTYNQFTTLFAKVNNDIGKQTLKKLNNLLEKHVNLTNDKVIHYPKVKASFLKSSLTAFRDQIEFLVEKQDKWSKNNLLVVNTFEDAKKANLQTDVVDALTDIEEEIREDNCLHSIVDHLEINT